MASGCTRHVIGDKSGQIESAIELNPRALWLLFALEALRHVTVLGLHGALPPYNWIKWPSDGYASKGETVTSARVLEGFILTRTSAFWGISRVKISFRGLLGISISVCGL